MGLAGLPCFLAESAPLRHTMPRPFRDLWVLVNLDLRGAPRLMLFRDAMVKNVGMHRLTLEVARRYWVQSVLRSDLVSMSP